MVLLIHAGCDENYQDADSEGRVSHRFCFQFESKRR